MIQIHMRVGTCRMRDCPGPCDDVLTTAEAEETTRFDAVLNDRLDRDDLSAFLNHADAVDHDIAPVLICLVETIVTLLDEHDV